MKSQWIIFDLDDTLIDTYSNLICRLSRAYNQVSNNTFLEKDFKKYYGLPNFDDNMSNLIPTQYYEKTLEMFYQLDSSTSYTPLVNYNSLYDLKKRGFKLGIITNSKKNKSRNKLTEYYKQLFTFIYYIEDLPSAKPSYKIKEHVFKKHEISEKRCIYIGDSYSDLLFCKNIGIKFIPVDTHFKNVKFDSLYKYSNIEIIVDLLLRGDIDENI